MDESGRASPRTETVGIGGGWPRPVGLAAANWTAAERERKQGDKPFLGSACSSGFPTAPHRYSAAKSATPFDLGSEASRKLLALSCCVAG